MDKPYPATVTLDCPNNCGKPTTLTKKESKSENVRLWYTQSLIKNYALISLVEAQRNLADMQKIQNKKEEMNYDKSKFKRNNPQVI